MSATETRAAPVLCERACGGRVLRLTLNAPPGNVLDGAMIAALRHALAEQAADPRTCAIVLDAAGRHFSFGASVEEHRADRVAGMLEAFHGLFRDLVSASRPLVAAVHGYCLGGGLELAAFCHRVVAAPDAKLGQPEITLGVFAPVASLVLPARVGRAAADDLLLTGRQVDAEAALRLGLVDEVADDPGEAAVAWAETHLVGKSASSLRHAVRAGRHGFHAEFLASLSALERVYLDELMEDADPVEGIEAFVARREPSWRDR